MVANRVAKIDEALACYEQVLSTRRVPAKRRKYFVMWVKRFDGFRVDMLKRPFRTCSEGDVVAFLRRQRSRYQHPDWQTKQGAEELTCEHAS